MTNRIDDQQEYYRRHIAGIRKDNPAQYYRLNLMLDRRMPMEQEDEFHLLVKQYYSEEKIKLDAYLKQHHLTHQEYAEQNRQEGRFSPNMLVPAFALLTFGQIDVIDAMLDNVPRPNSAISHFGICIAALKHLFPLPEQLNPLQDPEAVRQWIHHHEEYLHFDADAGRFVLLTSSSGEE
jgi:hypothetical protein